MLKKSITYTDYNGNERTDDFYFHLSKAELLEMELSINGGLAEMITRIVSEKNGPDIIKLFKEIILKAYGVKSLDGKVFRKTEELSSEFSQTEAYSILFMELATDADAASAFINGIMPSDLVKEAEKAAIPQGLINDNIAATNVIDIDK